MEVKIAVLPGDGIGPEVVGSALKVLGAVALRFGHQFDFEELMMGGMAMDKTGSSLPPETVRGCKEADAVLLGAVGGPKWDDPTAKDRPERGLLELRQELGLFANLRPVAPHPALVKSSPLRPELLEGVDMVVVRELTGGIYFGKPRERRQLKGETQALDTMVYSESEIGRIAHTAFQLSLSRGRKVTSVDKANVLESSRLWRQTVSNIAADYPSVQLEHLLVDAAAMHLLTRPASFDVIVTSNLFGDILTDESSVLAGSMGVLPSVSLGEAANLHGFPRGLYEPIHGSAPDIAGKHLANPVGAILSAAMLLRHSLGLEEEADAVEGAVGNAFSAGHLTKDLADDGQPYLSTEDMSGVIVEEIEDRGPNKFGLKEEKKR